MKTKLLRRANSALLSDPERTILWGCETSKSLTAHCNQFGEAWEEDAEADERRTAAEAAAAAPQTSERRCQLAVKSQSARGDAARTWRKPTLEDGDRQADEWVRLPREEQRQVGER